jgi:uncharacterized RmlC-like cupin family protein
MEAIRVIGRDEWVEGPSTPGMDRRQAIATEGMWSGFLRAEPGLVSGWHHHGEYESTIYVLRGGLRFEFGPDGATEVEAGAGEFVYVPRGVVHRERNSVNGATDAIVVRAGHGESNVNVDAPA